jgi:hypothetical protein
MNSKQAALFGAVESSQKPPVQESAVPPLPPSPLPPLPPLPLPLPLLGVQPITQDAHQRRDQKWVC